MGLTDRLDSLQQRYPALGFPLAVIYKYGDDQGSYLAALIAYYAFVSLFPLLLLLSTVLGWVLAGHPDLRAQVEHSALSEFPVIGRSWIGLNSSAVAWSGSSWGFWARSTVGSAVRKRCRMR